MLTKFYDDLCIKLYVVISKVLQVLVLAVLLPSLNRCVQAIFVMKECF